MTQAMKIIMGQIEDERRRQDAKWGEQHWPDGTGPDLKVHSVPGHLTHHAAMQNAKLTVELGMGSEGTTWSNILKEEIFEALCETEWTALRNELVQSAAVIVAWVESGDKRFWEMLSGA